jgi:hypothetical protein
MKRLGQTALIALTVIALTWLPRGEASHAAALSAPVVTSPCAVSTAYFEYRIDGETGYSIDFSFDSWTTFGTIPWNPNQPHPIEIEAYRSTGSHMQARYTLDPGLMSDVVAGNPVLCSAPTDPPATPDPTAPPATPSVTIDPTAEPAATAVPTATATALPWDPTPSPAPYVTPQPIFWPTPTPAEVPTPTPSTCGA